LAESRARVQAYVASQAEATVNSLLNSLCDAVVRLGPDFQVLSGSASLHTLLLKQPGSMKSFLEAIEQLDHDRFSDYSNSMKHLDNCGLAPSLHVGMRDVDRNLVDVQLFMASFLDLDNRHEYLLGIREVSRAEGEMGRSSAAADQQDHCILALGSSVMKSRSKASSNASSSFGSQPWENYLPEETGEVSVVFNIYSHIIFHATPAFIGLGGPSTVGANLMTWQVNKSAFETFTQVALNRWSHDEPIPSEFGRMRLQPGIAKDAQLEYSADCSVELLFSTGDVSEMSEEDMYARASLTNVSQRRCKKPKSSRPVALHGSFTRPTNAEQLVRISL